MMQVIESLKNKRNRMSTNNNYYKIWKLFNQFLIRLDVMPCRWEDRAVLFCAHLIDNGRQSSTVRSYLSAIKCVLQNDNYQLVESHVILSTLTRACRLVNDRVHTRLPIKLGLLEMILFEINRRYSTQPYLQAMYSTLFALAYYGLFRIGEVTASNHCIKACNVHMAKNKDKLLIILYSSKTHDKESKPQKVKITSMKQDDKTSRNSNMKKVTPHFCPFQLTQRYLTLRGGYKCVNEQFFIFSSGEPVSARHVSQLLKLSLKQMNFNQDLYSFHSLRSGRSCDLLKAGYTIDQIKMLGRWKSNAVYKYIKE